MSAHEGKHRYDCKDCKFNWCCGPLCACHILTPAPKQRQKDINWIQGVWRKSRNRGETLPNDEQEW